MTDPRDRPTRSPRSPRRFWGFLGAALAVAAGAAVAYRLGGDKGPVPQTQPAPDGAPPPPAGPPLFREVAAEAGVEFTYQTGEEAGQYTILESLGGGVVLIDYDGDGLLDLFLPGGGAFEGPAKTDIRGRPCKLFRNLGGWRFADVTAAAGLAGPWWYTHGGAVADYDRDGWPDLLVTGYGRVALFHNEPAPAGGRRFVDVTAAVGLKDQAWATSAAWADADGDGYPDLYVCHYVDWSFANNPICAGQLAGVARDVCPPQKFKPLVHAFFHNEKGARFTDTTAAHGFKATGCGLGVVAADLNADGRPDFYVANDATNNHLYLNRGGRLEERGLSAGVAVSEDGKYDASMGVDAGDYDGSGRPSLFVTNFQGEVHALYQNLGAEIFHHRTRAAGIAAIGQHYVGFGTGFIDFDNDGWQDLVIANGHVIPRPVLGSPYRQRPVLLANGAGVGGRSFSDVSDRGGPFFSRPALGRGLAVGDLDNDGWPDIVISHSDYPVALLRNQAGASTPNHWLGIQLTGKGHRCTVGSTVTIEVGGRRLARFAKAGGSYLSSGDPRLLFGLGEATHPLTVIVRWSWGATEKWEGLNPDQYWELREGNAAARTLRGSAPK